MSSTKKRSKVLDLGSEETELLHTKSSASDNASKKRKIVEHKDAVDKTAEETASNEISYGDLEDIPEEPNRFAFIEWDKLRWPAHTSEATKKLVKSLVMEFDPDMMKTMIAKFGECDNMPIYNLCKDEKQAITDPIKRSIEISKINYASLEYKMTKYKNEKVKDGFVVSFGPRNTKGNPSIVSMVTPLMKLIYLGDTYKEVEESPKFYIGTQTQLPDKVVAVAPWFQACVNLWYIHTEIAAEKILRYTWNEKRKETWGDAAYNTIRDKVLSDFDEARKKLVKLGRENIDKLIEDRFVKDAKKIINQKKHGESYSSVLSYSRTFSRGMNDKEKTEFHATAEYASLAKQFAIKKEDMTIPDRLKADDKIYLSPIIKEKGVELEVSPKTGLVDKIFSALVVLPSIVLTLYTKNVNEMKEYGFKITSNLFQPGTDVDILKRLAGDNSTSQPVHMNTSFLDDLDEEDSKTKEPDHSSKQNGDNDDNNDEDAHNAMANE